MLKDALSVRSNARLALSQREPPLEVESHIRSHFYKVNF
jgi:hypothetical protein